MWWGVGVWGECLCVLGEELWPFLYGGCRRDDMSALFLPLFKGFLCTFGVVDEEGLVGCEDTDG